MRTIAIAAISCGLLLLGGCGIKGPLFLPQVPTSTAKPDTRSAPAPASSADHNKPVSQDMTQ